MKHSGFYPIRYRVLVRNNGEKFHTRASWHRFEDAIADAVRATEEMGWLRHRLYPHVQVLDVDSGEVVAAWRNGREVMPAKAEQREGATL